MYDCRIHKSYRCWYIENHVNPLSYIWIPFNGLFNYSNLISFSSLQDFS